MYTINLNFVQHDGPEGMQTYTLTCEFKDRSEADLERLNALLSELPLTDLRLGGTPDTYTAICTRYAPDTQAVTEQSASAGIDHIQLIGRRLPGNPTRRYQVDVGICDADQDLVEFSANWRAQHPDRVQAGSMTACESKAGQCWLLLYYLA